MICLLLPPETARWGLGYIEERPNYEGTRHTADEKSDAQML
jgi:hypothetical protein